MMRALAAAGLLALCTAPLLCTVAVAGDEDRKPAYMIYIDPVTGKYTTEDPDDPGNSDTVDGPAPLAGAEHDGDGNAWDLPMLVLAVGVVVAMLVGAFYRQQRKPLS